MAMAVMSFFMGGSVGWGFESRIGDLDLTSGQEASPP